MKSVKRISQIVFFRRIKSTLVLFIVIVSVILASLVSFQSNAVAFDSHIQAVGDLDDGKKEEYLLVNHSLSVKEGEQYIWRSPRAWSIDSFALGDVNNDGTVNLVVTLWKAGSFGTVKPFWQTGEDVAYKNHLFVYQLKDKEMKQVWCSSNLDRPILSFNIHDVDGDGMNELVIEEGQYRKMMGDRYTPVMLF